MKHLEQKLERELIIRTVTGRMKIDGRHDKRKTKIDGRHDKAGDKDRQKHNHDWDAG